MLCVEENKIDRISNDRIWEKMFLMKMFGISLLTIFCYSKVMPCDLNPQTCQNGGSCKNDLKGGYTCTCPNGYTGTNCEIRNAFN